MCHFVDFLVAAGHRVPRPGARRCGVGTMDECSGHKHFERQWGQRKAQSLSLLSLKPVGAWPWTSVKMAKGSGRKALVTLASLFSSHRCSLLPSPLHTLDLKLLQQNQPFSPSFRGDSWGYLLGLMSPTLLSLWLVQGLTLCSRAAVGKGIHPSSSCHQLQCRSSSNLQFLKRRNDCGVLMSSLTRTNAGACRTVFIRPWCFVEARLFHGGYWFPWHFWWEVQTDFISI